MTRSVELESSPRPSRRSFVRGVLALGVTGGVSAGGVLSSPSQALALESSAFSLSAKLEPGVERLELHLTLINTSKAALDLPHLSGGAYIHTPEGSLRPDQGQPAALFFSQHEDTLDRRAVMSRVLRIGHLVVPAAREGEPGRALLGRYVADWPQEALAWAGQELVLALSIELRPTRQTKKEQRLLLTTQARLRVPSTIKAPLPAQLPQPVIAPSPDSP